ncbi:hypothetical protein EDC04DRAFT_1372974 [Pisolithus marmoratus]|nr:hypothetical protein EDC04DRAFT_1372974 [Pisolithus marmoratus]
MKTGSIFALILVISSARGAGAAIVKLLNSTSELDARSLEREAFEGRNVLGQIHSEYVHFRYQRGLLFLYFVS